MNCDQIFELEMIVSNIEDYKFHIYFSEIQALKCWCESHIIVMKKQNSSKKLTEFFL